MARTAEVRIAMIGYGFMGRMHSYAYRVASLIRTLPCSPRLVVLCGRNASDVEEASRAYGFEGWSTDWQDVVSRRDIDLVDVCTPPGAHAEVVTAAAANGKAIVCEKPLASNFADGQRAARAVTEAGVLNASIFNYRHLASVALMKRLIDEGKIGEPLLWRAIWLGDEFADPSIRFDWRFDKPFGGSTILDLGAHVVDIARWMVGEIDAVTAQSATFVTQRRTRDGSSAPVTVDDASAALGRFSGGQRGVFEFAKVCVGRPTDFSLEVNGREGTLAWDFAHLNELWFASADQKPHEYGLRRIRAEHPQLPYARDWWPAALGIGAESGFVNQICDLLEKWPDGPWAPDLNDALRTLAVCIAMEKSTESLQWTRVADVLASTESAPAPT
jgi:predicted dehydrogenase